MPKWLPPCDVDVFKNGKSLASVSASSRAAEAWVKRVAKESGQRVDWHYSGGRVHVLVLGDHAAALAVAQRLAPALGDNGVVLRWFDEDSAGLYRDGITPLPEGVIATAGDEMLVIPTNSTGGDTRD